MCKFHKNVAIAVATDARSGVVDPIRYSLTICALARFWVDKYMPTMGHLDGNSNYEMSTVAARNAFRASGLETDIQAAYEDAPEHIKFIRETIDAVTKRHHFTAQSLHLPKHPENGTRFLDQVMVDIYEGDPSKTRLIKQGVENPKQEPLRHAMETLFSVDGFEEAIEQSLKTSISSLFIHASDNINPKLLSIYDRLPMGLRTAFGSCSLHGGGGAVAHVVVCGGLNATIGGFSAGFMNAAMYAVGPAVAMATTYGVEKYRQNDFNAYKYVLPVAISLAAAFGISKILPHEHSADPRMAWFYSLNADGRYTQLQKDHQRYLDLPQDLQHQVDVEADKQQMTVAMFMTSLDVCGGELTPKIKAFETMKAQKSQPAERALN